MPVRASCVSQFLAHFAVRFDPLCLLLNWSGCLVVIVQGNTGWTLLDNSLNGVTSMCVPSVALVHRHPCSRRHHVELCFLLLAIRVRSLKMLVDADKPVFAFGWHSTSWALQNNGAGPGQQLVIRNSFRNLTSLGAQLSGSSMRGLEPFPESLVNPVSGVSCAWVVAVVGCLCAGRRSRTVIGGMSAWAVAPLSLPVLLFLQC